MFVLVIIGVVVVAIFASAIIKANRRMQYADTRRAMRAVGNGTSRPPSWATDGERVQEFLYVVGKLAIHKGVPEVFATRALGTLTNASVALAHCAGSLEAEGASFNTQKLAAADMLFDLWSNSSAEQREYLLCEKDQSPHDEAPKASPPETRSVLDELDNLSTQLLIAAEQSQGKRFVESYIALMDSDNDEDLKGKPRKPTWASTSTKLEAFTGYVVQESVRRGVAETYAMMMFADKNTIALIFGCIAAAELEEFDFRQQMEVAVQFIERGWLNLDEENRRMARDIRLDAEAIEFLSGGD